jgi:hypothetical protein
MIAENPTGVHKHAGVRRKAMLDTAAQFPNGLCPIATEKTCGWRLSVAQPGRLCHGRRALTHAVHAIAH